jgi:hypothetical protein
MGGREKSIKFINNLCKLRLLHESSHKDQAHDERTVEVTQPLCEIRSRPPSNLFIDPFHARLIT